ncbi:MAG: DUF721 domain-containing protein [Candidatus Saganbacteria bacterium]|nr:DUF721 domain-containing protein [Candidatus Saganbacteria bacterium]
MTQRISEILGELNNGLGDTVKLCNLLGLWQGVVDERVGKHTQAIKIRNRILFVSTSSPTWAQELTFLKHDIIEKFNKAAGQEAIRDIRFRSGGWNG